MYVLGIAMQQTMMRQHFCVRKHAFCVDTTLICYAHRMLIHAKL